MALTSALEWPTSLGTPDAEGYSKKPFSDLATFRPEAGPEVVRRRTGRRGSVYRVSYLLTAAERQVFDNFYEGTLSDGALSFNWTDPHTNGRLTVRIRPDSLTMTSYGPLTVLIDMELEEVSRA